MRKLALILTFLVAAGCTTFQQLVESEQAHLVVYYSVAEITHNNPSLSEDIVNATKKLKVHLNETGQESVNNIIETLRTELKVSDMETHEQVAMNYVLDRIDQHLKERIGEGLLDSNDAVYVNRFLDWIIESAS